MSGRDKDKPLPDIPRHVRASQSVQLTTLTNESHDLLRRFIIRTLEENYESANHSFQTEENDLWTDVIEGALRELGASIGRGGWLSGVRRAKVYRRKRGVTEKPRKEDDNATKERQREEEERTKFVVNARNTTKLGADAASTSSELLISKEQTEVQALEELRDMASRPVPPTSKPIMKRFLLTVAAYDSTPVMTVPTQDSGNGSALPQIECPFTSNVFFLPDKIWSDDTGGNTVLYGLNEWDSTLQHKLYLLYSLLIPYSSEDYRSCFSEQPFQLAGGTFQLKGTVSLVQHVALVKTLRLSVFMYLSILLEQHFLCDSRVELNFPKPAVPALASVPLVERSISNIESSRAKRDSSSPSSFWSFLSKRTENLFNRSNSASPLLARSGSLERSPGRKSHTQGSYLGNTEDNSNWRPLGFSFIPTLASKDAPESDANTPSSTPLSSAVKRIEKFQDLLSTSPSITFPPPAILVALAEKERREPSCRLTGDERAALTSILGWEGKESGARGMTGVPGFVRHQGFSVLYSEHICDPSKGSVSSLSTIPGPAPPQPSTLLLPTRSLCCGNRRKWITYRFYGSEGGLDESLGEFVSRVCETAFDPCNKGGCQALRAHHDLRWIHAGTRVIATLSTPKDGQESHSSSEKDEDVIQIWETCAICGKQSKKREMLDGT